MAGGGRLRGVHEESSVTPGKSIPRLMHEESEKEKDPESKAGWRQSEKFSHKSRLAETKSMQLGDRSGMGYADGGRVKGVHDPISKWQMRDPKSESGKGGVSVAGEHLRMGTDEGGRTAKFEHRKNLSDLQSMKRPNLMAEGGEVESDSHEMEDGEDEMHQELRETMGDELMSALDRKDKKGIMDALEACVLSIKGRHE
jgi:hypothetical protein